MENIASCKIVKIIGTSVEVKPTNVPSGSEFHETDTGINYVFNIATKSWTVKQTHSIKIVDGKPRISSMPYTYDIAEGNVTGHTSWSKIGYNAAIGAQKKKCGLLLGYMYSPQVHLTMTIVSDSAKDCQRAITAFANSANHAGVNTLVTCAAHGLADGDIVIISGTTSYNGTFTIEHTVVEAFEIIKAYVANDATGTVQGPGANTITVYYLDGNFEEKSVTKTMLGTTSVQIGTDVYRVQNARLATAGTSIR